MNNIGELQSKTISFIRFPLIVLIVYIHNQGMGTPLGEVSISWANFSGIDAYNLLRLVIYTFWLLVFLREDFFFKRNLVDGTEKAVLDFICAIRSLEYYCGLFHNCLLSHKRLAKRFKFYAYFLK